MRYCFAFAFIWSICASIEPSEKNTERLDSYVKENFDSIIFPQESVYDVFLDINKVTTAKSSHTEITFKNWEEKVNTFQYVENMAFFDILIPTIDTVKCSMVIYWLLIQEKNVFLTG